jgi:SAM-dependent methyltransferase
VPVEIHEAARAFARAPELYEQGRPGYPEKAIARLVRVLGIGPSARILDLAAGTGKLTRALVPTGAELVAVEPVAEMRGVLERILPQVTVLQGTAEAIPLPEGAVHGVVVAQAFHWFRGDEALVEIHRVLRAGGRLGLVWNVRDDAVPWVSRLTEIMESRRGSAPRYVTGAWRSAFERTTLFTPLRRAAYRHVHRMPPDAVVARVVSVSFIAALPEAERAEVSAAVRSVLATDPETRGRRTVELPYRTDVFWCARR